MDFYSELDHTLQRRRQRKHESILRNLAFPDSKEFQLREGNKWIKQRNDSEPIHPILALFEVKNPNTDKYTDSNQTHVNISKFQTHPVRANGRRRLLKYFFDIAAI